MECKPTGGEDIVSLPYQSTGAAPQTDIITTVATELFSKLEGKFTSLTQYYQKKLEKVERKSLNWEKVGDFEKVLQCEALANLYEEAVASLPRLMAAIPTADLKPREKRMLILQLKVDSKDCLFNLTPKDLLHLKALIIAINSGKKENLIALQEYLSTLPEKDFSKGDYFVYAFLLEANKETKRAAQCYLALFHAYKKEGNVEKDKACARKALRLDPILLAGYTMLSDLPAQKQTLLQIAFETQLQLIRHEAKVKSPTCFISYAWEPTEKKSIQQWIQSHLLGALDMAGIEAYFDCRELAPGQSIMQYMVLAAKADYVLLLCTSGLKTKYDTWLKKRETNEVGMEISLTQARFFDKEKGQGKVLPLIYEGEPTQVNPVPITHGDIYYDFRKEEEFHETCLGLCAQMCDLIPTRYIDNYNKKAEKIKAKQTISQEEEESIKKWEEEREIRLKYFWEPVSKKMPTDL